MNFWWFSNKITLSAYIEFNNTYSKSTKENLEHFKEKYLEIYEKLNDEYSWTIISEIICELTEINWKEIESELFE